MRHLYHETPPSHAYWFSPYLSLYIFSVCKWNSVKPMDSLMFGRFVLNFRPIAKHSKAKPYECFMRYIVFERRVDILTHDWCKFLLIQTVFKSYHWRWVVCFLQCLLMCCSLNLCDKDMYSPLNSMTSTCFSGIKTNNILNIKQQSVYMTGITMESLVLYITKRFNLLLNMSKCSQDYIDHHFMIIILATYSKYIRVKEI